MRKLALTFSCLLMTLTTISCTKSPVTDDEMKSFVEEAIKFAMDNGREKSFEEFQKIDGKFVRHNKELYLFCYDLSGVNIVHPFQVDLREKDLSKTPFFPPLSMATNPDGYGRGFAEFFYDDPITKKRRKAKAYVIGMGRWFCGSGRYLD